MALPFSFPAVRPDLKRIASVRDCFNAVAAIQSAYIYVHSKKTTRCMNASASVVYHTNKRELAAIQSYKDTNREME